MSATDLRIEHDAGVMYLLRNRSNSTITEIELLEPAGNSPFKKRPQGVTLRPNEVHPFSLITGHQGRLRQLDAVWDVQPTPVPLDVPPKAN
ncbi:hypothetical protein C5B85_10895 [Pseudoclavibacter sp. AY1F1]|uniref:hypothetical protein n=1 Tax=Pseudoclavibacter sp. AY1F1 TaxID=2080583 RepID=UPI000CE8E3E4|nr:hypothetical protein [Pseudoclavibacter sp. AY1F1]PPF44145.1 hypothetical protein C5B85_10895 [Pseudoclavibacter sp. AY1F1]